MIISVLTVAVLIFGFTTFMLCQERMHLMNRVRLAETQQRLAEKDALGALSETEVAKTQVAHMARYINEISRRAALMPSLPCPGAVFEIKNPPLQNKPAQTAHLN